MRYLCLIVFLIFITGEAAAQNVRITKVKVVDQKSETTTSGLQVDLLRGVCLENPQNPTVEPFMDSLVKLTVLNKSRDTIRFHSFSFIIEASNGASSAIRSKALAPISGFYVEKNETADITAFLLDALSSGEKQVTGARVLNSGDYGFKNVRFILNGVTPRRKRVKVTARQAISFDNFDRCTSE